MNFNAFEFNASRKTVDSDSKRRIKQILSYVLECHKLMMEDKVVFYLSDIKNSKIKPENKFRNYFVDNYLRTNKHLIENFAETDHIYFDKETEETFVQNGIEQTDKIDIYVRDFALTDLLKGALKNVYFAIECKRIKIKSDSKQYVLDVQKYVERNHTNLRLPFEGQIAFIENERLTHEIISDEINSILKETNTIITDSFLTPDKLHSSIDGSYSSKHKKNFGNNDSFLIYHLLLDYSKVVLN
uniref:hypothetical protein n=1 Tax=Flavobacterium sp. TaxID=239 RepID=UPI004049E49E